MSDRLRCKPEFLQVRTNYTCILVLDVRGVTERRVVGRLIGTREIVLEGLSSTDAVAGGNNGTLRFRLNPWVLVPPEEARL